MIDAERLKPLLQRASRSSKEPLPAGATDLEIDRFAQRTGIMVPDELRQWLKLSNGPSVAPGGLFGVAPRFSDLDLEACLGLFPLWKEKKWIPVAGDGCGNYYLMPTQGEFGDGFPIVFMDTMESIETPSYICASNLGQFLVFLLEDELGDSASPSDETDEMDDASWDSDEADEMDESSWTSGETDELKGIPWPVEPPDRLASSWPFDETFVTEQDPEIRRFHGVPFPWDR